MPAMKRLEFFIGAVVILLVAAGIGAFLMIPRPGASAGPGVAAPVAGGHGGVELDPARQLWKADPERSVYVFGAAARPGAHQVPPPAASSTPWTLKDLIVAVGGFTAESQGRARVLRKVDGAISEILNVSRAEAEGSADEIRPGDVIFLD